MGSESTSRHETPRDADRVDRAIAILPARWRWAAGVVRLTLREPADALDRASVRARRLVRKSEDSEHEYRAAPDWHRRLHDQLDLEWPCRTTSEFEQLWLEIVDEVRRKGLSLGRGTYGGWDDADPGLARAIWCLVNHLRPEKVIETGVARGVTSRVILEALERAGTGHLWSIDLPAMDPTLHEEIGIAVPERLYGRWTYISGTSRQRLPRLLPEVGPIDLFVHDSSHTERNVLFELKLAWAAIHAGAVVADDVHASSGFARFTSRLGSGTSFVVEADDASALFGIALKPMEA